MPRLSVIVRVAAPPPRRALVRCGLRRTVRALRLTAAAGRRAGRVDEDRVVAGGVHLGDVGL
ncbi:hypothetical protein, partial [Streptomyces sp. NPDC003487]